MSYECKTLIVYVVPSVDFGPLCFSSSFLWILIILSSIFLHLPSFFLSGISIRQWIFRVIPETSGACYPVRSKNILGVLWSPLCSNRWTLLLFSGVLSPFRWSLIWVFEEWASWNWTSLLSFMQPWPNFTFNVIFEKS